MIRIFKTEDGTIHEKKEMQPGSWIALTNPTASEIMDVADACRIDPDHLKAPLDEEERSRIEAEDEYTLILVDIPSIEERNGKDWFVTIPMAIITTRDVLITVCLEETPILSSFMDGRVRDFHTFMKTRFILGSALAAVLLLCGGTGKVMAQKNIDKMAAELEKRDGVAINSVTKRDSKTRKVVKVVKSFSLKDEKIGARLIEAFEKDEEYAETAIKDMPKGRGKAQKANFTFIYKMDNEKRTYTLNVNENGNVSMTVIISPMKDGKEVYSAVLDSEYWDSFNEQMAELGNNLRDSGIEVRQMSREEMEKMQKTIRQSLKGLDAYAIAE